MSDLIKGTKLNNFVKTMAPDSHCRHKLALDAARALQYLHAQRPSIMHGDLKPDNVMIELRTSSPCPKLVDFGLARLQTKHSKHMGGTTRWAAPEVRFNRDRPAPSADVYSFALLVYFIMTGHKPRDLLSKVKGNKLAASQLSNELCVWPGTMALREECRFLCSKCLVWNAGSRLEIAAIQCMLSAWTAAQTAEDPFSWKDHVSRLRAQVPKDDRGTMGRDPEFAAGFVQPSNHDVQESLQYPHLRVTPATTQEDILVEMLSRFNFSSGAAVCCSWHAMTRQLQLLLQRLDEQKCRPLLDWTPWQCTQCGLLSTADAVQCDYCKSLQPGKKLTL
eukprot:gnl/TRDRNA2_/TRDRNA2_174500_c0_seq2.p1 gnl/TRDRNA2_/TRDRNA2_174500_c0~~gnl/TRDRNA2_/TRDRNA2_174500_c0_seq2.p1  ORF type:complete len:342 (+),score=35.22 gnl/TRDRNA2_/TRDRNA2_174500_c0_seq2:26-1027(+)